MSPDDFVGFAPGEGGMVRAAAFEKILEADRDERLELNVESYSGV